MKRVQTELPGENLTLGRNLFANPPSIDDLTTGVIEIYGVYSGEAAALKSKLPMQKLAAVISARDQKERLLNYWSSVSIVVHCLRRYRYDNLETWCDLQL